MFNPKQNLLEEQLATSGLEMQWIGAAISAGTAIVGGIMGSNAKKKQNEQAEKNEKAQRKAAKEQARATNRYNQQVFRADQENYFNNRAYQYETALKNWSYNQQIKDYEYLAVAKRYAKSIENTENQLVFNSMAAMDAYAAEQAALNEIRAEDAFNQQGALVDRLQQEGEAGLGQAGVSRSKAIQSRIAAAGRNSAISDASLKSSVEQSQRNMRQIAIQKYAADMQAKASMMIRPEALPDIPMPELGPERVFVEPMKATPQFIPEAIKQDTTLPIIQGFGSAISTLAKVDWNSAFGSNSNSNNDNDSDGSN
jgi:type II secretory pathway pseudopilin PulG